MRDIIYKFVLVIGENTITIPNQTSGDPAAVVGVGFQHGNPTLWALTSMANRRSKDRTFVVVPTGQEFDSRNLVHVGTCISDMLVWHIFEKF